MATKIRYQGDWYEVPDNPTLGETAFVEKKLETSFDQLFSGQLMLAMVFLAVKRVMPRTNWDDIANAILTEEDVETDDAEVVEALTPKGARQPKSKSA